jgi:hypothetical protein
MIASGSEPDGAGFSVGRGGFGRGFIQPDYRLASRLSPDTPHIVMLSVLRRLGFKPVEGFEHFAEHRQAAIDAVSQKRTE